MPQTQTNDNDANNNITNNDNIIAAKVETATEKAIQADAKLEAAKDAIHHAEAVRQAAIDAEFQHTTTDIQQSHIESQESIEASVTCAQAARTSAEEEADTRLLNAVMAASLLEYKEQERILKSAAVEDATLVSNYEAAKHTLEERRQAASKSRVDAVSSVLCAKKKAAEAKAKAIMAMEAYKNKEAERAEKVRALEVSNAAAEKEAQLARLQNAKAAASARREEAEKKAREAREKAETLRAKALEASAALRASNRSMIDKSLATEDSVRALGAEKERMEIKSSVTAAKASAVNAATKASEASKKAELLMAKAAEAKAALGTKIA